MWSDTSATKIQATESALYYASSDHLVEIPEGSTVPSEIPIPIPAGAMPWVDTLGSDGTDLYAIFSYDAGGRLESGLFQVHCCGATEATKLATLDFAASSSSSTSMLVRDGGYLFWLDNEAQLEQTPFSQLSRIDLSTGTTSLVFANSHVSYTTFGAIDGVVYLGGDGGVIGLHLPGCFQAPLFERRARITALALVDGSAFWAELAEGLAFSRIFTRPKGGGTPVLIATADGPVPWISVDATDVYWSVYPSVGIPRILRTKRP
jgi:hypothetical protein